MKNKRWVAGKKNLPLQERNHVFFLSLLLGYWGIAMFWLSSHRFASTSMSRSISPNESILQIKPARWLDEPFVFHIQANQSDLFIRLEQGVILDTCHQHMVSHRSQFGVKRSNVVHWEKLSFLFPVFFRGYWSSLGQSLHLSLFICKGMLLKWSWLVMKSIENYGELKTLSVKGLAR